MIDVLPDMPEGVFGIRVSGRVRGDDLRDFRPTMDELLKTGEIRIVEVISPDYEGFGPGRGYEARLRRVARAPLGIQTDCRCVR